MAGQIDERIRALRCEMAARGIDIYIVPTADFHESEYVGEYFKARQFITGFTGSAGTAVITADMAGLWTDGRYFVQARRQLEGTNVTLFPIGEDDVPTVEEFAFDKLPEGGCVGFDGRVVNAQLGQKFLEAAEKKHGALHVNEDLVGLIWNDRPPLSAERAWVLDEAYAGQGAEEKIAAVRGKMKEAGAEVHILTSLYDIAWFLNIRGNDIDYVPVVLSYLVLTENRCVWFVQEAALDDGVREYLKGIQVEIAPYEAVYAYVEKLCENVRFTTAKDGQTPETEKDISGSLKTDKSEAEKLRVLLDLETVNYRIASSLPQEAEVLDSPNPTEMMKAVKNPTELENIRAAHVKDGIAFTKFMYWLKTNVGKIPMTEISASDYLKERRREQEHFLELSFDTICAYGANAAMMHYAATPETDATLRPEGLLLVDSGGHYMEGTTDITRTMALGPISDEERRNFTAVCRANLNLAAAKFLYGCTGLNLDVLAREPMWEMGLDYKCGTGHGVGYILNVHEGPNGFRWRTVPERRDGCVLEEGMVTTDEPGVYIEGHYGIRTENELVCRKGEKNEYGQFMELETITYAPIDLDALDVTLLSARERELLNAYHRMVYETISPYMTEDEAGWLVKYTRAV